MKPKIFISYRRGDGGYVASTIFNSLAARFGSDAVVRDIENIEPGASFQDAIVESIQESTVVLAVIGPAWLASQSADGRRRIDDPGDFVRLELETAFAAAIPVIPVLVGDAIMPAPDEFPETLQRLSRIQSVAIRSGRDVAETTDWLVQAIERFVTAGDAAAPVLREPIQRHPPVPPPLTGSALGDALQQPAGSVFISYRREGGAETARLMRYELRDRGWHVFLDVEDLKSGHFDKTLLSEVASAENFLLILSEDALKNCAEPEDWLRREITQAIDKQRNIVPLLKENVPAPLKEELPDDIATIARYNCVDYSHVYYDATIDRLLSFLKKRSA